VIVTKVSLLNYKYLIKLLNYKYLIKLIIEVVKKCKMSKNNKIIIYLKKIVKKFDKYFKDKHKIKS